MNADFDTNPDIRVPAYFQTSIKTRKCRACCMVLPSLAEVAILVCKVWLGAQFALSKVAGIQMNMRAYCIYWWPQNTVCLLFKKLIIFVNNQNSIDNWKLQCSGYNLARTAFSPLHDTAFTPLNYPLISTQAVRALVWKCIYRIFYINIYPPYCEITSRKYDTLIHSHVMYR